MEQSSLINLPVEVLHRIFDFCDIQTILCTMSCVCKRLHSITNYYNRFKLELKTYRYKRDRQLTVPPDVLFNRVISLKSSWWYTYSEYEEF
ncbi:hypothetical protein I4U23_005344 [Adineta vaga]|nr:hypothetical protein I4U23_005344 [Adineta vaga]